MRRYRALELPERQREAVEVLLNPYDGTMLDHLAGDRWRRSYMNERKRTYAMLEAGVWRTVIVRSQAPQKLWDLLGAPVKSRLRATADAGAIGSLQLGSSQPRYGVAVEDTWVSRDLPVLDATLTLLEEGMDLPEVADIADRSGLPAEDVARALRAMNGRFVALQITMGDSSRWFVNRVMPEARQAVGQWPTGESAASQLVDGLDAAAEQESDPERKSRLRQAPPLLGGAARDVVVDIAAKVIERGTGLG